MQRVDDQAGRDLHQQVLGVGLAHPALAATRIAQVITRVIIHPVAAVHFGPGQAVATTPGLLLPAGRRRITVVRAAGMRRRAVAAGVMRRVSEGGAAANAVAVVKAMASKRVVFMEVPPSWPQHAALWREYRAVSVNEYGFGRHFSEQTARPAAAAGQQVTGPRPGLNLLQPSLHPTTGKDPSAGQCAPRARRPMRTPHLPARPGPKAG